MICISGSVGHDNANSIFRVQSSDSEAYPQNREHPYAKQFHMQVPRDGSAFDFSAFFCGIGDARHLYASLVDLGLDLGTLKPKKSQSIRLHFVLVSSSIARRGTSGLTAVQQNDIHPTVLSRALVVLTAVEKISQVSAPKRADSKDPLVLELLLMLHYVYWGTTMPPAARRTLDRIVKETYQEVLKLTEAGEDMDLPWLHIDHRTLKSMIPALKWWTNEAKTVSRLYLYCVGSD